MNFAGCLLLLLLNVSFVLGSVIRTRTQTVSQELVTRLHSKYVSFYAAWILNSFCFLIESCLFLLSEPTEQMYDHSSKVKSDEGYCTFEEVLFNIKSREPESPSERERDRWGNMMSSVCVHQSNTRWQWRVFSLLRRQVTGDLLLNSWLPLVTEDLWMLEFSSSSVSLSTET